MTEEQEKTSFKQFKQMPLALHLTYLLCSLPLGGSNSVHLSQKALVQPVRGEAFQINSEICLLVIVLSPAHSCSPIFPSIFSPGYVFTTLRPLAIHAHTRVPTYTHRVMETVYYIIRDFCFCGKLVSNPHFSLVIVFPIS